MWEHAAQEEIDGLFDTGTVQWISKSRVPTTEKVISTKLLLKVKHHEKRPKVRII